VLGSPAATSAPRLAGTSAGAEGFTAELATAAVAVAGAAAGAVEGASDSVAGGAPTAAAAGTGTAGTGCPASESSPDFNRPLSEQMFSSAFFTRRLMILVEEKGCMECREWESSMDFRHPIAPKITGLQTSNRGGRVKNKKHARTQTNRILCIQHFWKLYID
jgi:hypothetical protein